jgi:hypothetical protein
MIGPPDATNDKSFLDALPDNHYQIKTTLKSTLQTSLNTHFQGKSPQIIHLLSKMLKYSDRPTASELLQESWFKNPN